MTEALPGKQHLCIILCLEFSIKIIMLSLMIIFQDYKNKALMHFSMAMNISMPTQVFLRMKNSKKFNTLTEWAAKKMLNGSSHQETVNLFLLNKVIKFISSLWDILADTHMISAFQI